MIPKLKNELQINKRLKPLRNNIPNQERSFIRKKYENHEITENFERDQSLPPPPPPLIPNKPQLPRANTTAFCQIQQQNDALAWPTHAVRTPTHDAPATPPHRPV